MHFAKQFTSYRLKKGESIRIEKEYLRSIIFLAGGMLHQYQRQFQSSATSTINETIDILQPGDFMLTAFDLQQYYIEVQALENSQLMIANLHPLQVKQEISSSDLKIYLAIGEYQLMRQLAHIQLLKMPTALARYNQLRIQFGKHLFLVPYQYQASYIGISRKHLSRLNTIFLKNPIVQNETEPNTDQHNST